MSGVVTSVFDGAEFNGRLFYPRRDKSAPPAGAVERFVDVPGARLHLREHAAVAARATIVLFHGNGEVVADYDEAAPQFASAGAALAVVDYRGYGSSTGTPTLRNLIDDAPAVVAALGGRPVIVMGRSLGSAAAAELYRAPPTGVRGFIWESGFVDLDALVERRGYEAVTRPSEDERRVFDPIPKLRVGRSPLLVIHGADDDLIVPREAQEAFDAAGTPTKTLVFVPDRGHNDVSDSPMYWEAIEAFVRGLT
jgi:alpha-beta hydrolase superfamily lysophospholipase